MVDGIDREELRKLVRDVLRSSMPAAEPLNLVDAMRQAVLPGHTGLVAVDDDLNRFAQTIVQAAENEDLKAAIMSGRLKFTNSAQPNPGAGPPRNPEKADGTFRLDQGMLSETRVAEIGKSHTKIILGSEVVVTPLARDRARELKLQLVRSKS
jgi:hypothetical protein